MPLTPATWLNDFIVNDLTTTDAQNRARVTQLANGNILVVWDSSATTGVASNPGIDVIGQVFTPLGEPVGVEFRVNQGFAGEDQRAADVAALPDGGFLVAYEVSGSGLSSVVIEQYSAAGVQIGSDIISEDTTPNGAPSNAPPVIAVSSATSALVAWERSETGNVQSEIIGRIYNPSNGALGPDIVLSQIAGVNFDPAVAVLNNGNYVIACSTLNTALDAHITYRIFDADGNIVLGSTVIAETFGEGTSDTRSSVTALADGGFVITWVNVDSSDQDILSQRYDENGISQGALNFITSGGANATDPVTVALPDGGYLVIYDDNDGTPGLRGVRISATNGQLGNEFTIVEGDASDPDAVFLEDGRVAVTFRDAAGEIRMEIIDTRDAANATGVYFPESWQIGTIGNDTITGDGVASFVFGHDGNDTINSAGNGLTATYSGGAGNDVINVVTSVDPDTFLGDAGTDLIDWSASGFTGGTFNLTTGQFTNGVETRVMTGFEGLTGTGGDDDITGTTGANSLSGGSGDDTINGGNGNDTLDGGSNLDRLFGGANDDILSGGGDADVLFGGEGNDRFESTGDGQLNENHGDGGNDTFALSNVHFFGNIFGGAGTADHVDGSGSVDFALVIDLASQFYNDGGQFTLTGVENATGGGQADSITGDGNDNTLAGGLGNDTLFAGTGSDRLSGDAGNDTLIGDGAGNDTFFGGADTDTLDLSGSAAAFDFITELGIDSVLTGLSFQLFEIFRFGGQDDVITTDETNTVVETVFGGAGNDTVIDTSATTSGAQDSYDGGIGIDTLVYTGLGSGSRTVDMSQGILFSDNNFPPARDTFTGFENITITAGNNNIIGDGADNILTAQGNFVNSISGGDGNDTIDGGQGADLLFGGNDDDRLTFGTFVQTVQGGAGNDTYAPTTALIQLNDDSGTSDTVDFSVWNTSVGVSIDLEFDTMSTTELLGNVGVVGIENVRGTNLFDEIFGDGGANRLEGNGGADSIYGASGNDTLNGGSGSDRLEGGLNDDLYVVDALGDVIVEGAGEGIADAVAASASYVLGAGVQVEVMRTTSFAGTTAINLTGNALAQSMTGNAGINVLTDGAGAADALRGAGGNDTYVIRTGGTVIIEGVGEGTADRVQAAVSFVLATDDNIEFLQTTSFTGTTAINLTGNALAQQIVGNAGINLLTDGAGAADALRGGAGNDSYVILTGGTVIVEGVGEGTADRVQAAVSFVLATDDNIEFLQTTAFTGTTAINLTGNALAQEITGNAGVNVLTDGAGAADALRGGAGNDSYVVRTGATVIVEGTGEGTADRVQAAVSFVLATDDNIEFLQTTSFAGTGAISLTGNALSQTLIGNAGINTLDGGAGVDTLTGSLGNDTYIVRNAATNIDEGAGLGTGDRALFAVSYVLAGSDNIEFLQTTSFAGTGAINLTGNAISQTIVGNAGANRIDGKGGNDTLNGGAGADVFVFTATLGAGNVDRIQSYASASDQIELENTVFTGMIDTNALLAGSAFTSNTSGQATAGTHRIIHETDTGFLWFDQDGVAGGAIHFATVDVGVVLTAGEFTVI